MANYQEERVKLTNIQLKKWESTAKVNKGTTLREKRKFTWISKLFNFKCNK